MASPGIPVVPGNRYAGDVHGAVVQAGYIGGGVHLHPPSPDLVVPQQLPGVTWHFTGRTTELGMLTDLLEDAGGHSGTVVISPTEPVGGIGTTSLATQWATEFAARFPDGALYVNLRGSDPLAGRRITPDQVILGFLHAFGVAVPAGADAQLGTYRSVLAGRRVLLLLDDARDAEQVRPLLPGNSACWVVVTSLRPMPDLVATAGARSVPLGPLDDAESRELLRRHLGEGRLADDPAAVAELVRLSGGVPLALNVIAAQIAARPTVPLSQSVTELHVESRWVAGQPRAGQPQTGRLSGDRAPQGGLAAKARVVYSWAGQRADTGPLPDLGWSNAARSMRSLVAWARRPQAFAVVVAAVIATLTGVSVPVIEAGGVVAVGYLLLHVAALVGAVVLTTRTADRQAFGIGCAAAMATYLFGDALGWVNSTSTVWVWLYLFATLAYLGVLAARYWPLRELRRRPRFLAPATRPLAFLVLAGVFGQVVLLFVAIPENCPDVLGDVTTCTITVNSVEGPLGLLFFVVPMAALCVLVALTEPLDTQRRRFVLAAVVAFYGPEVYLMLASLVMGTRFTYLGDDVFSPDITGIWYVLFNAAMVAAIGVGTIMIARSAGSARAVGQVGFSGFSGRKPPPHPDRRTRR